MWGLALCGISVAGLVGAGVILRRRRLPQAKGIFLSSLAGSALLLVAGALVALGSHPALAAEGVSAVATTSTGAGLGFLAASLATGLACLGAGFAVSSVGSAALGLVGEKPEMLGSTLIYLGLAEGIAIYGLVVSILLLNKI